MQAETHRRLLTQLTGEGLIVAGDTCIAQVSYTVDVWQTYTAVREGTIRGGLQELDIWLYGPRLEDMDLEDIPLTLVLADGRRIVGFWDETGFVALVPLQQA